MTPRPELFLDTSALFAGIWSADGGARQLLRLGELELLTIVLSRQVLLEIEASVRQKAPHALGQLAILLDRVLVRVTSNASDEAIKRALTLVSHPGDAQVLADAWEAEVDFFVTLDQKHFLANARLRKALPFPLGTPGDALGWYRERLR